MLLPIYPAREEPIPGVTSELIARHVAVPCRIVDVYKRQAIDRVTLGWQLSDLIIIAARPSMGKTAFVLSMARNMACLLYTSRCV